MLKIYALIYLGCTWTLSESISVKKFKLYVYIFHHMINCKV